MALSVSRPRKLPLWLPYVSKITVKGQRVHFNYNGGEEDLDFSRIHSIMFYGEHCPLSALFLDRCRAYQIPLVIHRRNISSCTIICPSLRGSQADILTRQIMFRSDERKRRHIARMLLKAKFDSMSWLLPHPALTLRPAMSVRELRGIEAWHAKRYWALFYRRLGILGTRRGGSNPATLSLDAVSKFISGIVLRWIIYHHLSPYHGYLHDPTDYPSLVYDLMEPYRGFFDRVVLSSLRESQDGGSFETGAVGIAVDAVKKFLYRKVYVSATRQIVTRHELIHGCVLALRSYLLGVSSRFIVPVSSFPKGGRPVKAGYRLYGRRAGRTDFWERARLISSQNE